MTVTIEVFDPAMCCSTGVCGPTVDPDLARFEADLRWLGANGASVTRYNLASEPGEFVTRPVVVAILTSGGEEALPVILIDGLLRFSGTRPSRADLAARVGIEAPQIQAPAERADLLAPASDPCCTPTEASTAAITEATTEATPADKGTGCCVPTEQAREPQTAAAGRCC